MDNLRHCNEQQCEIKIITKQNEKKTEIVADGYHPAEKTFTVNEGQITNLNIQLVPIVSILNVPIYRDEEFFEDSSFYNTTSDENSLINSKPVASNISSLHFNVNTIDGSISDTEKNLSSSSPLNVSLFKKFFKNYFLRLSSFSSTTNCACSSKINYLLLFTLLTSFSTFKIPLKLYLN